MKTLLFLLIPNIVFAQAMSLDQAVWKASKDRAVAAKEFRLKHLSEEQESEKPSVSQERILASDEELEDFQDSDFPE